MKTFPAVHPFLFAIYPILFLASHNANEAQFIDAILPTVAILVFTLLLLLLSRLLFRHKEKSEILVSVFLLLFFSFGHAYEKFQYLEIDGFMIGRYRYFLLVWGLLLVCSVYIIVQTRRNLRGVSKVLNFLAVCLILLPAINIGAYSLHHLGVKTPVSMQNHSLHTWGSNGQRANQIWSERKHVDAPEDPLPDIYYFILDMYGGSIGLKEAFGYSNDAFLDYLRNKGFYVAERSYSNYAQTYLSLASSLSMQYIHDATDSTGTESKNIIPLARSIRNNKVYQFLRSKGYRYIHFKSRWGATRYNKFADMNIGLASIIEKSDFSKMLIDTTMLSILYSRYRYAIMRKKVLYTFEKLQEIPDVEGSKFVLVHFLLPHPPFIFGPHGEKTVFTEAQRLYDEKGYRKHYLGQIAFLNRKLQSIIDVILSKSTIPPIIVMQGDHGIGINAEEEARGEYAKRMSILNAYHLPKNGNHLLYDSISPINSFRLILRHYFNAQYDLLDDRSFYSTYDRPFTFIEVSQPATSH